MNPLPEFLQPLQFLARSFPREAMEAAIARRDESIPHLLHALEWADQNPEEANDPASLYTLHLFALHLLAQFREQRAHPLMIRLLCNPQIEELTGDMLDNVFPRAIASTCGADTSLIKAVVDNKEFAADPRVAAICALGVLARSRPETRPEISAYYGEVFRRRVASDPDYLWEALTAVCVDLRMEEHLDEIRRLYKDGVLVSEFGQLEGIELAMKTPVEIYEWADYMFIDDAIAEMQDWSCFLSEEDSDEHDLLRDSSMGDTDDGSPGIPVVRAEPKIGRNESCPCGSGKKYKKCCGAA